MKLEDILNQVKQVEEKKLKEEHVSSVDPRILTFKQGARYKIRLLPNTKDVANTFVTYEDVGFTSRAGGGEYVYAGRSPANAGVSLKNDILRKVQWDAYSKAKERGDKPEMDAACKLIPNRKQMINGYLHDVEGDDASKAKVGQVIVLRYPARVNKQKEPTSEIYAAVHDGLFGSKASKIGGKALDLSSKGRSLEIKVTEKDGWNAYSSSWDDAEDLDLSPAKIKEIMESVHDLTELVPAVKPDEELKQLLDEHWFVKSATKEDELEEDELPTDDGDDNIDDLLEGIN